MTETSEQQDDQQIRMSRMLGDVQGPRGSAVDPSTSQVYFVESGGRLSRFDMIRRQLDTVSEGEESIPPGGHFDFDLGDKAPEGEANSVDSDVSWDPEEARLVPSEGVQLGDVGPADFEKLSSAEVQTPELSAEPMERDEEAKRLTEGSVFVVETTSGNLAKAEVVESGQTLQVRWKTYELSDERSTVAEGFEEPRDIEVGSNNLAYVTEEAGNLLIVDLEDPDRSEATELVTSLEDPSQLSLDEKRNQAFVVEGGEEGRLTRVDLSTGATDTVFEGLENPVGLAMGQGNRTAYVSEDLGEEGQITEIDFFTEQTEVVAEDLTSASLLQWASDEKERLIIPDRGPENRLLELDIDDLTLRPLLHDLPFGPCSTILPRPDIRLLCHDDGIEGIFFPPFPIPFPPLVGPIIMGVGEVPETYIEQSSSAADYGYATTKGAGVKISVEDAPFGGTLPIKINHEGIYRAGANYYRVLVERPDGTEVEPRQAFVDHRWSTSVFPPRFVRRDISPASGGYYPVRAPHELWYEANLGYMLDTSIFRTNGTYKIKVECYAKKDRSSKIASLTDELPVEIDNGGPRAKIKNVIHHLADGSTEIVDPCAVVEQKEDDFEFDILAEDPQGHCDLVRLDAIWQEPKSSGGYKTKVDNIEKQVYNPSSKSLNWSGPGSTRVPGGVWDAKHTDCAHRFRLKVRDRVINGRNHIHRTKDETMLTLLM